MKLSVVLITILLSMTCIAHAGSHSLSIQKNEDTLNFYRGDQPLLTYNITRNVPPEGVDPVYGRNAHIHPLYTPAGQVLTAEFPVDHTHQSGLFSAWTRTTFQGRTVDFWNLRKKEGFVEHREVLKVNKDSKHPSFTVKMAYVDLTSGSPIDVLHETWLVKLVSADEDHTVFDIKSTQLNVAKDPLIIEEYHYGGMAYRASEQWNAQAQPTPPTSPLMQVVNSEGLNRIDSNHKPTSWVQLYGDLDGKLASLTVMAHPDNFRYPQIPRVHHVAPYFVWSPQVAGAFTIKPGDTYTSKFRYISSTGQPDSSKIKSISKSFK